MGCPYEGDVRVESVVNVAKKLYDMGCYEISLGDTIGVGYPLDTRMMVRAVKEVIPVSALAIHCHDTYNRALLNIAAVIEEGVAVVDSSVGGLGGCPYAKGATGNVATGEVLEMLETMGIKTGVDRAEIQKTAQWIRAALGKK
jgi:hydroxymethylglutaryl-CoA lyase